MSQSYVIQINNRLSVRQCDIGLICSTGEQKHKEPHNNLDKYVQLLENYKQNILDSLIYISDRLIDV